MLVDGYSTKPLLAIMAGGLMDPISYTVANLSSPGCLEIRIRLERTDLSFNVEYGTDTIYTWQFGFQRPPPPSGVALPAPAEEAGVSQTP